MRKVILLLAVTAILASCVSGPAANKKLPPDWVLKTPAPDGTFTYFVGSSSAGNDEAVAIDDASNNLIANIMNYIGARVSVDSTATAKATLDSYEADILQTVRAESSGQLAGFSVKERFKATGPDGSIIMYILASYQTNELEKEKARIAAVFQERIDAVARPEQSGDNAKAAGRWFDAVQFYVEAALAATGSDIDNAAIKAERNVNKARDILGRMTLQRLDSPTETNLGKDFPAAFQARLVYGEGANAPGIAGAEVLVRYQRTQANGRPQTRTERLLSGPDGILSFTPPPADAVGNAKLSFELNLNSTRDLIDRFPRSFDGYADALISDMSRQVLSFDYKVVSLARTIPTGVAIIDLNDSGNPAGTNIGQGGIFESLARERFVVTLAPINEATIAMMNDSSILQLARQEWGNKGIQRFIYGTTRIDSVVADGTMWKATASMNVKCVELSSGQMIYSREQMAIAIGATADQARRTALLNVSRDGMAKNLMATLP
ncbi:MAG: hypothetical protein KKI09_07450 [Spirochaetes bacterium]|nr:hypothetical protein [Spirochaetota bacterium]MBU0955247.1 hypothetical protein [Spirochaetota bacterium]